MWKPRDFLLVPLALTVAGGGLFWGVRNTYRTLRNWSPAEMTCADYVDHPPAKDWVRLTGCEADSNRLGIESMSDGRSRTEDTGIYVPLRPVGRDERVKIVLFADHGPLLALGDLDASDAVAQAAADSLTGELEAMRLDALDMSHRTREDLEGLHLHLAADYVVLDWHGHPRPLWLAVGVLLIGGGAAGWLARKWRRRTKPVELAKAKLVRE